MKNNNIKVGVLITTSMRRVDLLVHRALESVVKQTFPADLIVIVDDNITKNDFNEVELAIKQFSGFPIIHIPNNRTKGMSGTGAWNSGILFLYEKLGEDAYVAILDDDDAWEPTYLKKSVNAIQSALFSPLALFAQLKRSDCENSSCFSVETLTMEAFLKGNPGIQGSNMFFKIKALLDIEGFDEKLASCTDRDLMIRFIQKHGTSKIVVIAETLVFHYASRHTVTANKSKKVAGLNFFYNKYLQLYRPQTIIASLERAKTLFDYDDTNNFLLQVKQNYTILITGIAGFIASHIAKVLIMQGYQVVGIDNFASGVWENISAISTKENFTFYECSILDEVKLEQIFTNHKINAVFHLAALPRIAFAEDFPNESHLVNVQGTKIIANISCKYNVERFVFSSSSSVYGQSTHHSMSENDELHPISNYAAQKMQAETILQDIFNNSCSHLLILRLFNIYGFTQQPINNYSTLIHKITHNQILKINGSGKQRRDFTYISDAVNAFVACIEAYDPKRNVEIINIGKGKNESVFEIIQMFQTLTKRKLNMEQISPKLLEPSFTLANTQKAKTLLKWQSKVNVQQGLRCMLQEYEEIAICVAMHNNSNTILRCIQSIVKQKNCKRFIRVVLGNDNSSDNWKTKLGQLLELENITIVNLHNNNVIATRNCLIDYIQSIFPKVVLIGRLDADDEFADEFVLSKIENIYDSQRPDVILAGNYQRCNGIILDKPNLATKWLLNKSYLIERLESMSMGIAEVELPSCNLFVHRDAIIPYPNIPSGEDHALLVHYLLNSYKYKIAIAENVLSTIYTLNGNTTMENKMQQTFISSRKQIYQNARNMIMREEAVAILVRMGISNVEFLGQGAAGVVFHDDKYVYKLLMNNSYARKDEIYRRLSFFKQIPHKQCFYEIEEILEIDGTIILKYLYEKGEICSQFTDNEAITFLTECWQNKIIVKDCKPKNFLRVGESIKLIDMEGSEYSDNLWLNMCARIFIFLNFQHKYSEDNIRKLQRSAINNFDLPELAGLREFVNRVYANIIFQESRSFVEHFNITGDANENYCGNNLPNLERLFFQRLREGKFLSKVQIADIQLNANNYFEPQKVAISYQSIYPISEKVSLLIKTCPQDVDTMEANIKHIVRQLSSPNPFFEIVVSIDTKEQNFLREYNNTGTIQVAITIAKKLMAQNVIDRYIVFDQTQCEAVNKRWFSIVVAEAYSVTNAPVAPQLFAFENCNGDYILQADCDVLIGRKDYNHSFLTDMISELRKNDKVLSVGFNIYNNESKAYFGFNNGGFVPEVRLAIFDKKRLFNLRPFPNSTNNKGELLLTWHRSIERFQKENNYYSIRGGNNSSFFIHPQNYRKKQPYSWLTILDRIEQLYIPDSQFGKWDCDGSLYDWCIPKRNEKIVVVSVFRNVSVARFLRMWCSLMSQDIQDFGIILVDANSDNGLPIFIEYLIAPYHDRVTFIRYRTQQPRLQNEYLAIHNYIANPETIVVMLDGDDALIGKDTLGQVWKKYNHLNADVVVGRMHQTYRLQPHYRYPVDFVNPRARGGNVWQHLKTFKKYLFDSIPLNYFKTKTTPQNTYSATWFPTCDDFAMMVPMIEMAKNPMQMDTVNYFYERDYDNRNAERDLKEQCISEILTKSRLSSLNVFHGRKSFIPTFDCIEIDITYECNLHCVGCNRSCSQMPTKERMELADINQFIVESITLNKKWKMITILGGEPTLHPDFSKIIEAILQKYIICFSPQTIIKIVSNGFSNESRELCEQFRSYKQIIVDKASYKQSSNVDYFSPFNDAPIDCIDFVDADFSQACWVAEFCGIGLNKKGYYGCAVCGGIDRVLRTNTAIKALADVSEESVRQHYKQFCKYCGNFKAYAHNAGNFIPRCEKEPFKNIISPSWQELYKNDVDN